MLSLQEVYLKTHGSHNGHLGAIRAIVDAVEKDLNGSERWKEYHRNVTDLLHQLQSLKSLGMSAPIHRVAHSKGRGTCCLARRMGVGDL